MKEIKPVPIIRIDYRESSSIYVEHLTRTTPTVIEALKSGDIVIENLGIERKTISDFFLTLKEGRLWEQLSRLKETFPRQLLLIEGYGMRHHLDTPETMSLYIRICAGWQIPILHTNDGAHTAVALKKILHQDVTAPSGIRRCRPRINQRFHPALRVVMSIEGIGLDKAQRLLDHFGDLRSLFAASENELLAVKGIGKSAANKILAVGDQKE